MDAADQAEARLPEQLRDVEMLAPIMLPIIGGVCTSADATPRSRGCTAACTCSVRFGNCKPRLSPHQAKTSIVGHGSVPALSKASSTLPTSKAAGPYERAAYGATKFAVHALTEALRREVGPHGVRVSLVEPGCVRSGFQAVAGYSDEMVESFEAK